MSESRKKKIPRFIVGLVLGALVGIFLAPKSGRETRAAIATGVDDGRKYVTSLGQDTLRHVSDIAESGRKMLARKK